MDQKEDSNASFTLMYGMSVLQSSLFKVKDVTKAVPGLCGCCGGAVALIVSVFTKVAQAGLLLGTPFDLIYA